MIHWHMLNMILAVTTYLASPAMASYEAIAVQDGEPSQGL